MIEDFELPEEMDPMELAEQKAAYEAEIERAMIDGWNRIASMGINDFVEKVPMTFEKKKTILTNMMEWYASPDREEYEKAAILRDGLKMVLTKI